MIPKTFAQVIDYQDGDNLGIQLIDSNPVIKKMMGDIFKNLDISSSKAEQVCSIEGLEVSFEENPDVKAVMDLLVNEIPQLKHLAVYEDVSRLMSLYLNSMTLILLVRTFIKDFYKQFPPESNISASRHSYSEYMLKELIGQCSYKELVEGMPYLDQINQLLLNWNEDAVEVNGALKKKGRKSTSLEQVMCFQLREILKVYNGRYMDELITVLKAFNKAFPDHFEHLPYLTKEGIKKAIERGSKLPALLVTSRKTTATK